MSYKNLHPRVGQAHSHRKSVASTNNEPSFDLWLEFEIGPPNEPANRPTENFCNIQVTLDDNRTYAALEDFAWSKLYVLEIVTFSLFLPFIIPAACANTSNRLRVEVKHNSSS